MKTKNWLILLASCLALASAPLTGCGDDGDPSTNNSSNNGNNGNNGGQDAGLDGGGNDGGQDGGGMDGGVDSGDDTGTDSGQDAGTDTGGGGCVANDVFTGQAYTGGQNPSPHNGGNPVEASTITLDDANLQAVIDALPDAAADDDTTADVVENVNTLDTPISVSGALVIGTGFDSSQTTWDDANGWLFLQDGNTTLVTYGIFDADSVPADPVKVGDKVSFDVTEITNFGGQPEVSAIDTTTFAVDSSDNDVPYTDLTDSEVTMDYYGQTVRVSGELTAVENPDCGSGNVCYTLTHGDGNTVTLRTKSNFVQEGSCVTFFGPMSAYPQPYDPDATDPAPQLNTTNFDWLFSPPTN